jgi:transposase-like protein
VQQRWNGNVECPFCAATKVYRTNRGFKCADRFCAKKFTVTVGTIYENSKVGLRIWFAALNLVSSSRKGVGSLQPNRQLGITQKTAWFVLHRIREMLRDKAPQKLSGTVEVDESYIGGKERTKHKSKRTVKGAQSNKTPMVGLLQRNGGMVVKVLEKGTANGLTIKPIIHEHVQSDATIYTDGFGAYQDLKQEFKDHQIVDHSRG